MPYFRWHDLAVVFYYAMQGKAFGRASIPIHSSHLDMWGKTAEEIYHMISQFCWLYNEITPYIKLCCSSDHYQEH